MVTSSQSVVRLRTFMLILLIVSWLFPLPKLFTLCTSESNELGFSLKILILRSCLKIEVEEVEVRTVRWLRVPCSSTEDSVSKLVIEKCENCIYTMGWSAIFHPLQKRTFRSIPQLLSNSVLQQTKVTSTIHRFYSLFRNSNKFHIYLTSWSTKLISRPGLGTELETG